MQSFLLLLTFFVICELFLSLLTFFVISNFFLFLLPSFVISRLFLLSLPSFVISKLFLLLPRTHKKKNHRAITNYHECAIITICMISDRLHNRNEYRNWNPLYDYILFHWTLCVFWMVCFAFRHLIGSNHRFATGSHVFLCFVQFAANFALH